MTARDPEHGSLQLTAGDGGQADVYTSTDTNITISRCSVGEIVDVIADLLKRLGALLVLPGGTVILQRAADRAHLPQDLKDGWSHVVAPTGEEIAEAIRMS
ncbi:hypothetical protein [Streptomyces coeruleorubidus]|uniref:hypothetical protein n=1 Tax=Streptomyces coeruleorubidus TaxID=116188 RepID=UPI0033DF9E5E